MCTHEITATVQSYREILAEIKELEAQADALKQELIREMDVQQAEELHVNTCHRGVYCQPGEQAYIDRWSGHHGRFYLCEVVPFILPFNNRSDSVTHKAVYAL